MQGEQEMMAPDGDNGQGAMAPDGDNGRGNDGAVELSTALEESKATIENLQKEVQQLQSVKGQLGHEVGQTKSELSKAMDRLRSLENQTATVSQRNQMSAEEIATKYENNEISFAQAMKMQQDIILNRQETMTRAQIAEAQRQMQDMIVQERYEQEFLRKHPDYLQLFESGKLTEFMNSGMSGERAYDRYKMIEAQNEKKELEKKLEKLTSQARSNGVQAGIKLEQAKAAPGRVLGQSSGAPFTKVATENMGNMTPEQRREAAKALLAKIRGAAG